MTSVGQIHAGKTLGRYELLLPLAQGGTASVWAAKTKGGIEKVVAVKAMLSEYEDAEIDAESMFLDEARIVSRIHHPNVAEVLDLGEQDDALYIVMEWVDGEALHVVAREAKAHGGFPLPLIARIASLACSGLQAAHELRDDEGRPMNLVHRDVSPQNILVGYDGSVKVIDFGVAKAMNNQQRTNVGQIKGKVPYMSPEQALGNPVDRRTDVFAMGIVLYQLVTGKHPFRGDNEFVTLAKIRDPNPAPLPSSLAPGLLPAFEQVIMKALSKSRDARYATMIELRQAIDAAVPPVPSIDEELARFMRSILGKRAEKKAQAIREAMRAGGARAAPQASIFDDDADDRSSKGSNPRPAEPPAIATPAPAAIAAPAPIAGATATPIARVASEPPPDFRKRRTKIALIAVGVTLLVAAVLAIWSASGDATAPDQTPSAKKPW